MSEKKMNVPEDVRNLLGRLKENGYAAFLVGGCVRDHLLGIPVSDYDIATAALPGEIEKIFPRSVPLGKKFGTILVMTGSGPVEITTFRRDIEPDGRHTDVQFCTYLETDLERRDFTINALAYDLEKETIIDYWGGGEDLRRKTIRTVGDPVRRFREDYLRVFRGVRFSSRFGFKIEQECFEAMKKLACECDRLSAERVQEELVKSMKQCDRPSVYIRTLHETGLLELWLPEVAIMKGVEQNKYHKFDCFDHSLAVLDCVNKLYPLLRLTALLHDCGKPATREFNHKKGDYTFYRHEYKGAQIASGIMSRLRFGRKESQKLVHLVRNHMYLPPVSNARALRRYIRRIGPENLNDMFRLHFADIRSHTNFDRQMRTILELWNGVRSVLHEKPALSVKDLAISGKDLIELGLEPSPLFRTILDRCLEVVLDRPERNTRAYLLEEVEKILKDK